ncbi:nucleotide sugar aminotransferase [Herminiimonas sp. KBW02]|uniref:DegT/DnrJ/EryC1/StrS family aminotransferase n=1 Tax=Herminiimonas sp. KBW02 TaxID=2153363 RepID=UPI000F59C4B4|nr:DegT/DnrJ/EryC1/StrS family aminotransferase [Herminiimonas sp. KBW02]RQO33335.1 nucleotide sugar aminotransferase [Herminiimonas sp. KBW02]
MQFADNPQAWHEVPPTAGLPLHLSDLLPGRADLAPAIADFLQVEHAQLESSGTAALIVALHALHGLAPHRHIVVIPAYTCPLVALAVVQAGLTLRICDLQPDSLALDTQMLSDMCDSRTLAILPTHLCGRVSAIHDIQAVAQACGAWVIEDAAQALGAKVGNDSVGSQSDIAIFSLAVGKGLSIYEGGVLIARDPAIRAACAAVSQRLAPARPLIEAQRAIELAAYALLYRPALLPLSYGRPLRHALYLDDWLAAAGDCFPARTVLHKPGKWRQAVGVRALKRLPAFQADLHQQAVRRLPQLRAINSITVLEDEEGKGTWPVFILLLPDRADRDAALQALWGSGCGVSLPFVHALPDYPYLQELIPAAALEKRALPNARRLAARILSISNSPWLDDASFSYICATLANICKRSY